MISKLTNRHGQNLDFRFHESPNPIHPNNLVLIGHGLTANLERPFLKALAEALAAGGFHALRFSFSGNGASEGDFRDSCISRNREDLAAVIDAAAAAGFAVCYAGHSMGGAVGVLSAADDPRIGRLVSLAGMVETARFVEAEFGSVTPDSGFMWDEPDFPLSATFVNDLRSIASTAAAASRLTIPFLMVHGSDDDLVPVTEARDLFLSGAGQPGQLIELAGDHVFSGEATAAMTSEVVSWLKRHS